MSDIQITIDHELSVAEIAGVSVSGVGFVDSFLSRRPMQVVDAGRIIIHSDDLARLERDADNLDLSIDKEALR